MVFDLIIVWTYICSRYTTLSIYKVNTFMSWNKRKWQTLSPFKRKHMTIITWKDFSIANIVSSGMCSVSNVLLWSCLCGVPKQNSQMVKLSVWHVALETITRIPILVPYPYTFEERTPIAFTYLIIRIRPGIVVYSRRHGWPKDNSMLHRLCFQSECV